MAIEVLKAAARLDDPDGIERFIAEMPKGESLRTMLRPGEKRRVEQYDAPTRSARYLLIDGTWFVCFVVCDISLTQAQAIARRLHDLQEWSTPNFHRVVERALGVTFPRPADGGA